MSNEVPSLDSLQAKILQDYGNQVDRDGNPIDTSKGSITYIDSVVLASCLQGIYFRIKRAEGNALPNLSSSTTDVIYAWAGIFEVDIDDTDTDADVVRKLFARIQQPSAGGNELDWEIWGDEISVNHKNSDGSGGTEWIEQSINPNATEHFRWPGSVELFLFSDWSTFPIYASSTPYDTDDLVYFDSYSVAGQGQIYRCLQASLNNEPDPLGSTVYWEKLNGCSDKLVDAARIEIEELRALGLWENLYQAAEISSVEVEATVTGSIDTETADDIVAAFIDGSKAGQLISRAEIIALLVELGAKTVDLIKPADDVVGAENIKSISGAVVISK